MGLEAQEVSEWPEADIGALHDAIWKHVSSARQTRDERRAAEIALAAATGIRLNRRARSWGTGQATLPLYTCSSHRIEPLVRRKNVATASPSQRRDGIRRPCSETSKV